MSWVSKHMLLRRGEGGSSWVGRPARCGPTSEEVHLGCGTVELVMETKINEAWRGVAKSASKAPLDVEMIEGAGQCSQNYYHAWPCIRSILQISTCQNQKKTFLPSFLIFDSCSHGFSFVIQYCIYFDTALWYMFPVYLLCLLLLCLCKTRFSYIM